MYLQGGKNGWYIWVVWQNSGKKTFTAVRPMENLGIFSSKFRLFWIRDRALVQAFMTAEILVIALSPRGQRWSGVSHYHDSFLHNGCRAARCVIGRSRHMTGICLFRRIWVSNQLFWPKAFVFDNLRCLEFCPQFWHRFPLEEGTPRLYLLYSSIQVHSGVAVESEFLSLPVSRSRVTCLRYN